jgi:parvulin-like peptidyl-prolyl isomerase
MMKDSLSARAAGLALVGLLAVPAAAASADAGAAPGAVAPSVSGPAPKRLTIDRVAAVVNSTPIFESDLDEKASAMVAARLAAEPDLAKKPEALRAIWADVLDAMIVNELVQQEAAKLALTVTSDEIDRAVEGIIKRYGWDRATFLSELKKEGYTEAAHRDDVRQHLLRMKVVALKVRSRISTDDDVLKAYYEKLKKDVVTADEVRLSMIMFSLPPKSDPDYAHLRAEALAKITEIKAALDAGKPFAELAAKYAPDGPTDGDWGYVKSDGLIKEVRVAVAAMKPGDVRVVVDDLIVRVVKLSERKDSGIATFESIKADLLDRYVAEETDRLSMLWFEELKSAACIDYKIPEIAPPAAPSCGSKS